ncbi:MAG TPA: formate/nitrite transporter family protein [Chloroflexota bacterium]|nr:formate/nitrite transporter family protein [Chloroflexota bacterium]
MLLSNLAGCVLVAFAFLKLGLVPSDVADAMLAVSKHLMPLSPGEAFRHGIGAGFLIAALVWMMPSAEGGEVILIVITAWLIALGGFNHVIAGSVETALLVLDGQIGAIAAVTGITLPVLAGNVVGGTALFALLSKPRSSRSGSGAFRRRRCELRGHYISRQQRRCGYGQSQRASTC